MSFLRLVSGLFDRLSVVIGAFLGSQIPAFMQQYTQRLAGHVAELQILVDEMNKMAAHTGKTLEQYTQKFLTSSDVDFVVQGQFMLTIEERWKNLSTSLAYLTDSSMWTRPYVFLKEMNYDIAQSTFHSFQPSINLSIEGMSYTLVGILVAFFIYQGIIKSLQLMYIGIRGLFRGKSAANS